MLLQVRGTSYFRYWENGSLGVKERILKNLPSSKTPNSESNIKIAT